MAFVEHAIREPGGTPTAPGVPAERAEPFQPRTLTLEEFDAREAVAEAPEAEVASVETAPATIPGQPAPAAVVPASPTPNGTQKVITTRGNEIEVQYELVEADNLIVSHTDDLSKNPAYPQEIQPRQRDRAASAQQIAKIAGNLRPELLGVSPKAGGGAPIVGSDGVVESGNGRVLAVVRAYRQGFEGAQRYRDWLVDQGYDQAADMREPVLIRRRITEMTMAERARFAREANTGTTLGMSAGEQAAADAADMPAGLLDQYQGGNVAAADNRGFVTRFAKAIVPEGEQARFFTGEGQLSQEGRSRIENAIFATAYGRPELLSTLREDLDNNIRGIGNALIQAAPAWAQMRAAASSGQIPATLDITQDVLEVIDRVGRARTEGVNPQAAMAQIDAFAGEVTPAQQAIFGWFYEGRRPRAWAKVATDLEKYATEAAKATTGPNLLGLADVTPEQLIATVGSQGVVGAPNLASVAGEAGGALPTSAKSNSLVGSQAEPLKTSMRPDPSGISTPRTRAPSTTEGTINTDIKPPSLGDIDPASNHVIIQTFSNPEEGLKQAAQLKDGYVKDLQQVAKDTGATFVRARVKKPGMLQAKVTKKRPANTISDYLGAQLLIEDPAMLGLVLEDVRAKWRVLEEENFLETPKAGYRAVHLQVEIAPGFTAELQLVPETIGAVQEKTHLIYNKWKRVTEFTPAQMKVFKRDMAKMNKIFANAWLKSPFNLLQSVLKPKSVDAKAAARLRKGADSMQKQIDAKRESGVVRQRSTNRRERMADSARQDADRLADIQTKMRALADGHEVGTLPEVLQGITSRAMVEGLRPDKFPWKAPKTWPKSARDDQNLKITRMKKAGIRGQRDFNKAKKALDDLANFEPSAEQRQERESQELRREVAGIKIPGFFETPPAVAAHMVEVAEIEPGMSVLEPSAGAGAIARQIRDQAPEADLDVIEFNPTLAEILKKQDFAVDNADFLEHKGAYDRIIMNPPFEKHQDVEHVKHAFSLLKPGGRLVSIMSPTHASEPRFRDWTEGKLESVEGLASGTFQQTGVASKIITLFKELALDETGAVRFPGAQGQPDTIDLTDQGEQRVIPGAERSTAADAKKALKAEDDRKKLEIQTRQTKMGRTGQQGVDEQEGGLFSTDEARGQGGLFDDTTDLHAGVHLPSLKKQWHRAAEEIIDWLATGRYSPFANRFLKGYPWRDPTMADLEQRSEYLDMRQILQGTIGRVERVARRLNKVLRKASAEDQAMAYEYLTTRGVDPSSLPARIRGATVTAKSSIKKLGRQLVREGMISQESYEALADTYLPRVYLKHLLEHTDFGVGLKASDMGYTNPRIEDLPEEYKEYLGEIKDVPFLVTKALSLPARDMAILHFLRDLTQNPAWVLQQSLVEWTAPGMQTARKVTPYWLKAQAIAFRRRIRSMPATEQERLGAIADDMDRIADEGLVERGAAPKDFREMPNSPRYGDLRGLVVRKEIYDDIVGKGGILIGEKGAYDKTFDKLAAFNAFWKKMKVPFNPPTQVRNFVSNGVLLDISGVPFEKLPILYARAFSEIIRGMAAEQPVGSKIRAKIGKQGKHYRIAVRRGIRASTFTSAELRNIEPDILRVRAGQGGPMEKIYKMGEIMARLSEKPGDIYQLSETLGKMVKIIDVMEREGGSEAEAVAAANEALFDYSLVPNLVKSLRTRAIGAPFITFYYKAFPAVLKGAIKHPGKMAKYYILPYVLGDMLLASLKDVDEDDVEKLREALPQWMQDQGHVYIYPYKDASGRWAFVNYGYFLPWSMHERTVRNAMEVAGGEYEGSVNDFMSELGILGGPVPQIISAMMTGVDPFSGREIIKDTDPPKEQIYKLLNYAWRMGGPSWLTDQGVVGHMQRSLTQTPNYYGDAPMSPEQAAGRMVGINIYPTDPVQSRQRNIRRKVYEIDRTRRDAKRSLKNRSLDAEKKADLRQQYRGQIKQLMDDLKRYRAVSQVHPRLR